MWKDWESIAPFKEGYEFIGWNVSPSSTDLYCKYIVLKAEWIEVEPGPAPEMEPYMKTIYPGDDFSVILLSSDHITDIYLKGPDSERLQLEKNKDYWIEEIKDEKNTKTKITLDGSLTENIGHYEFEIHIFNKDSVEGTFDVVNAPTPSKNVPSTDIILGIAIALIVITFLAMILYSKR